MRHYVHCLTDHAHQRDILTVSHQPMHWAGLSRLRNPAQQTISFCAVIPRYCTNYSNISQ